MAAWGSAARRDEPEAAAPAMERPAIPFAAFAAPIGSFLPMVARSCVFPV